LAGVGEISTPSPGVIHWLPCSLPILPFCVDSRCKCLQANQGTARGANLWRTAAGTEPSSAGVLMGLKLRLMTPSIKPVRRLV
jgi:hypothetical protein